MSQDIDDAKELWKKIEDRIADKLERIKVPHPEIYRKVLADEELDDEEMKILTGAHSITTIGHPFK